ncbi:MAG: decaprenyl-phosphate phosphoribosyltransferase [Anaerolineae bacterium]
MLRALIKAMRPKQWPKNVFLFAGLFFDGRVLDASLLFLTVLGFILFCLISSAIYLINDLIDVEKDRVHPTKRLRPIASGALPRRVAMVAAAVMLLGGLPAAFLLSPGFGRVALLYVVLMIAYDLLLKNLVILDVMTIAAGFVLRVFAGAALVVVTRFSPWLYVCTTLLALFIGINKRRHELLLLAENANSHRNALDHYSLAFLDNMTSIVTTAALVAYSFYTFSAPNVPASHSMMLTIPFVLYGIFRYLYLIHMKNLGGTPEEIVLSDRPLQISLLLWGLTAGLVIYAPTLFQ